MMMSSNGYSSQIKPFSQPKASADSLQQQKLAFQKQQALAQNQYTASGSKIPPMSNSSTRQSSQMLHQDGTFGSKAFSNGLVANTYTPVKTSSYTLNRAAINNGSSGVS